MQARGGMAQTLEIGTNSPNLVFRCEMIQTECLVKWNQVPVLSACPPLLGKGGVGEGCSRHRNLVQTRANSYKPIFWRLRIRPGFYDNPLPTANPHPTLPLQARGGMAQALEVGTNSPNLVRHFEVVPRGRLRASPTVLPLQTPICRIAEPISAIRNRARWRCCRGRRGRWLFSGRPR